jgi:structure-specific recognition protein 1
VASSGMAWKGEEADSSIAVTSNDIKWAQWLRVARGFQLRVGLKDRRKETFDGFEREVSSCYVGTALLVVYTT